MLQFYDDAKTGNLPAFSWINPRAAMNKTLNQGSNGIFKRSHYQLY